MSQFGFKIVLPPPGASDVATRELSITVNGGDPPTVKTYPGATLLTDEVVFNADDQLVMTLVDIDGHGNRSQPSAAFSYAVVTMLRRRNLGSSACRISGRLTRRRRRELTHSPCLRPIQ